MPIDNISPLPEIPDRLRIAAGTGRLVLFIGAGASRLAKCPSWEEFADGLLRQLVNKGALNHSQAQQIRDQHLPPRMKLSFVRNIAAQAGIDLDYEDIIHARKDMSHPDGRRLYRALGRLSKTFVTTNYDYWLDAELAVNTLGIAAGGSAPASTTDTDRAHIIYKKADISFDRLMTPGTVIHLHGSLRSPTGMIVTTSDYLNFYRNVSSKNGIEENPILTFLQTLFNERIILFVGYGLADLELLEYVVLKSRSSSEVPKHYILQPFFSHELEIAKLYERYYAHDCGMLMLPFLRDNRDHLQLIEVAEHLASVMPGNDLMAAERQIQMEKMLDAT